MKMKIMTSDKLPAAGPYSVAVEAGDFIFISGQLPVNPSTGEIIMDIRQATRQVLTNLKTLLEENGLSLNDIVKTTVFLKSPVDFAAVNDVYAGYFLHQLPARSMVAVSALPKSAPLEIEAVAMRKSL